MNFQTFYLIGVFIFASFFQTTQAQTVFLHETFANGFAGGQTNGVPNGPWISYGTSSNITNPFATWEYRGPNTTPNNTIGSRGAYVQGLGPIASTTANDGFIIFDSDYLDNGGIIGNFGFGNAPTPHKSWIVSSAFSTIGTSNISITMEAYYRRFASNGYILLSNDNGLTWGDTITIYDENFGVNNSSDSNEIISEQANFIANSANAKIAFYFDGQTPAPSANGLGYYFFMIDDIKVIQTPNNDLVFNSYKISNNFATGHSNYYSMIPQQIANIDTLSFTGFVENSGATAQTNTIISNQITTPTGSSTLTSNPFTINSGNIDSAQLNSYTILNQGIGEYSWVFSTSSDSIDAIPHNNFSDSTIVNVTDTTYARDRNASGNYIYSSGDPYEIGCVYNIPTTETATSITIQVGNNSSVGEPISVFLYDITNLNTPIASTQFVVLTANKIGIPFSVSIPPTVLTPGDYLVTYRTYTIDVSFVQSDFEADPWTSFVDVGGTGNFGWINYSTVVRLNLQPSLSNCNNLVTTNVTTPLTCANSTDATVQTTVTQGIAPYSYLWSNGSTTTTASPVGSGWQHVTITDAASCVTVDSIFVQTPPPSNISLGPNRTVCYNSQVQLNTTNTYASYLWSTGETTPTISINTSHPSVTNYSVTATNTMGCEFVGTVEITVQDTLTPTINGNFIVCANESTSLYTTPNYSSYLWNTNETSNSIQVDGSQYSPGVQVFSVTVTDANQCEGSNSKNVTILPEVIVDLGPDSILWDSIGQNSTYTLDAGAGFSQYLWSNGTTLQTLDVTANNQGTFSVTVTDQNNCQNSDTATILIIDNVLEFEEGSVSVYPIPAQEVLYIDLSNLEFANNLEIELINIKGQTIYQNHTAQINGFETQKIDVSHLTAGPYILQLKSEGFQKSIPVLIQ